VIGAFALSNNLFIIAIGLGIGAMFVRSLTIMLVEQETRAAVTSFTADHNFWIQCVHHRILLVDDVSLQSASCGYAFS
jgi:hypothetical protein